MGKFIFVAFVGVPILEIAIFIQVGGWLGVMPTVGLILLTAITGTLLLRQQGLATLARAQAAMGQGEMPIGEVVHGLFLLIAGVLLLTPGFATDIVGLLLFLPAVRLGLGGFILHRIMSAEGGFQRHRGTQDGHIRQGDVIEGEFERVNNEPEPDREPDSKS